MKYTIETEVEEIGDPKEKKTLKLELKEGKELHAGTFIITLEDEYVCSGDNDVLIDLCRKVLDLID